MPDDQDRGADIGTRVREVRKRRGLTQRELSSISGVSLSLIRKLEQGERSDTRLETARQLAAALRVPTTRLLAASVEEGARQTTIDQWEPVRRALAGAPTTTETLGEPTLEGVRAALKAALPLYTASKFAELSVLLPQLLRDADAVGESGPEARALRAKLMQLTGRLLVHTRQFDAAEMALERALDGSVTRVQAAATISTQCWLLLRRGQLADARTLATRWADDSEPTLTRATPAELSVWGRLLLRVSAASARDNRPGEAEESLRFAHAAAVAMGREHVHFARSFGPLTVALKRAENAMISDDPERVLRLAERVPAGPATSDRNRHLLDVANAYARTKQYADCIDVLTGIQEASPQWLPHQRYARDILGLVVERRRTLTPQMRVLADAVGLPM